MKNLNILGRRIGLISAITLTAVAFQNCSDNQLMFNEAPSKDPLAKYEADNSGYITKFYKYSNVQTASLKQDDLGKNTNTLKFRVSSETPINPLDLIITENGTDVTKYKVVSTATDSSTLGNIDIALVIDDTGSMGSTIESAKIALTKFINDIYDKGSNARICITTFGDNTTRPCNKFFLINKLDPISGNQRENLLSELNSIRATGGADRPENPLRAILDALNADWIPSNQQFMLLVTDVDYHHSESRGDAGALAPSYKEFLDALSKRNITIFGATNAAYPGYNTPITIGGTAYPGLITHTNGEWFDFTALNRGTINFGSILDRIVKRTNSYYTLSFISDENSGLQPTLPITSRNIVVRHPTPGINITDLQHVSSHPNGRAEYKSEFSFTNLPYDEKSIHVTINRTSVNSHDFTITSRGVKFRTPPQANANISIEYRLLNIRDGLEMDSIFFSPALNTKSVYLRINGKQVQTEHFTLERSLEGRYSLLLNEIVFSSEDPYGIKINSGLNLDAHYLYYRNYTPENTN